MIKFVSILLATVFTTFQCITLNFATLCGVTSPPPICGCSPPIGVVGATAAIPEPGDELNSCLALATLCLRCLPLCGTFEVPWGRTWDTFFRLNPQPGDPSPTNFAHAECESQPDEATVLHRSDLVRGDPRIAACACALLVPQ